jgi:hypothetical protein
VSEVREAVAAVLAEHEGTPASRESTTGGINRYARACICGEPMPWEPPALTEAHRTHVAAVVEQVVAAHTAALAAKVAAVEALADEWTTATCQTDGAPCSWHRVAAECADELRAALAAVPDTAPSGVLDGPSFGDYWPAESVPDTAADAGGDAGVGL